jgi:hypothetical protein
MGSAPNSGGRVPAGGLDGDLSLRPADLTPVGRTLRQRIVLSMPLQDEPTTQHKQQRRGCRDESCRPARPYSHGARLSYSVDLA